MENYFADLPNATSSGVTDEKILVTGVVTDTVPPKPAPALVFPDSVTTLRVLPKKKDYIDFKKLAQTSLLCSRQILEHWLPGGKYNGNEYLVLNPLRSDSSKGSFSINRKTGKWADFAIGDKGGDFISLIAYLEKCGQLEAAYKLTEFMGYR